MKFVGVYVAFSVIAYTDIIASLKLLNINAFSIYRKHLINLSQASLSSVVHLENLDDNVLNFISNTKNDDINNLEHVLLVSKLIESLKETLYHGYLPDISSNNDASSWPDGRMLEELYSVMTRLNLPSLTRRHPELIPSVIRSILDLIANFCSNNSSLKSTYQENNLGSNEMEEDQKIIDYYINQNQDSDLDSTTNQLNGDNTEERIKSLVSQFEKMWSPPLSGLMALDDLYGYDHGLLSFHKSDASEDSQLDPNVNSNAAKSKKIGAGNGQGGFGLFDGVWTHTGWKPLKTMKKDLKELKDLLRQLGKRPSVHGREMKKYPPQVESTKDKAPLGVSRSMYSPIEMAGIRKSDILEGLLPSETILLSSSSSNNDDSRGSNEGNNTQGARRRKLLFLVKYAEKLLSSYEKTGWVDQYSLPARRNSRHFHKLPVVTGGPIIICLDTSWSMLGARENLAKSVVLESTVIASKFNRPCYVISFSGSNRIEECSFPIGVSSKQNFLKLLDFLSNSFHGGTDVTAALETSLNLVQTEPDWAGADIILISDGELQNPPVSNEIFELIARLEREKGLLIHGLLVGKKGSEPLELLCSDYDGEMRVYDFLYKYDPLTLLERQLYEKMMGHEVAANVESDGDTVVLRDEGSSKKSIKSKYTSSVPRPRTRESSRLYMSFMGAAPAETAAALTAVTADKVTMNEHIARIDKHIETATESLFISTYGGVFSSPEEASGVQSRISKAVRRIGDGLIERDAEARLLVLAALCREHIVLLGPPGTGKSDLARRLASATELLSTEDNGKSDSFQNSYFERLLTKYTNPEELFGPLSLRALENDQYVRNTAGYLPSASIAFLDEIFKSNSAILNSLLTILNERKFDNGNQRVPIPLMCVVAASNELPESEELDALYDRFLFRKQVYSVSDTSIDKLLALTPPTIVAGGATAMAASYCDDDKITSSLISSLHSQLSKVRLSPEVASLIKKLRVYLRDENDPPIYLSDRRLVKIVNMLKIVSIVHNRKVVSPVDCLLLSHILWFHPEDQQRITDYIHQQLVPPSGLKGFVFLMESLVLRLVRFHQEGTNDRGLLEELEAINKVLNRIASYQLLLAEVYGAGQRVVSDVVADHFFLSAVERATAVQQFVPKIRAAISELTRLLHCTSFVLQIASSVPITSSDAADIEVQAEMSKASLHIESTWDKYVRQGSGRFDSDRSTDEEQFSMDIEGDDNDILTAAELNYSKKKAYKALSPEKLKLWKKAQKSAKKNGDSDDTD